KVFHRIGAELDSTVPEGGDLFDRLAVLAFPGDGGISDANISRRRPDRSIEVGQIHRWIHRLHQGKHRPGKRRPCPSGSQAGDESAAREIGKHRAVPPSILFTPAVEAFLAGRNRCPARVPIRIRWRWWSTGCPALLAASR